MEFLCDYQFMPQLDLFTLRYNTIVYLLQNQAGFKVKSFLLNVSGLTNPRTKKPYSQTDKAVFMLLRQSVHNLLKIADRYHIKK